MVGPVRYSSKKRSYSSSQKFENRELSEIWPGAFLDSDLLSTRGVYVAFYSVVLKLV